MRKHEHCAADRKACELFFFLCAFTVCSFAGGTVTAGMFLYVTPISTSKTAIKLHFFISFYIITCLLHGASPVVKMHE